MVSVALQTFAHAFGQRYELPIPLLLFVLAGAGIVLVSFFLIVPLKVAALKPAQKATDTLSKTPLSNVWAVISIILFALFVLTGIFGSQEIPENIVPTLFWLVVWIAVPLSCGLLGDWTRQINPFGQVARLLNNNHLRQQLLGQKDPLEWSKSVAWWPAVVLYFGIACGELIYNQTATKPVVTAAVLGTYFVVSAFMGLLYGQAWLQKGELFSVLFSTWGKLGWFRFGGSGANGFAGGLRGKPFDSSPSRVVFVMLLLVSVSFDGLLATPAWSRFEHGLPANARLGTTGYLLVATVIFALLTALFVAVFYSFARLVAQFGNYQNVSPRVVLTGLLPSLLPISFGYLLAHNIEYLVVNGQLLFPLIGNPTGLDSWPLHLFYPFNDSFEPNIHLLPSWFYWYLSVLLIIAVHVLAVVLAHQQLAAATKNKARARRSEYPWIAAMILYTMLSLWLLAQPLVKEKEVTVAKPVIQSTVVKHS